jgi:hypothetical protein
LLAALLLFQCWLPSSFVNEAWTTFRQPAGDYDALREFRAAEGFPLREVQAALDARLPSTTSISIGPELQSPLQYQRLIEYLYPRRIDPTSPYEIDLGGGNEPPASILSNWRNHPVVLRGPPATPPASVEPTLPSSISWWRFALRCLGVLGWGFVTMLLANRIVGRDGGGAFETVGGLVVGGATTLAVAVSAASWLQVKLPLSAFAVVGVLAATLLLVRRVVRHGALMRWRPTVLALPRWESTILVIVGVLFLLEMTRAPVAAWDGRSIWLFRTKQIAVNGFCSKSDLSWPTYQFAHGEYPLLFPAFLAMFSGLAGRYDERMAALGIPVLLFGLLACVWHVSRRALGRWPGAMFAAAVLFVVVADGTAAGAYADPYVTLLALVFFLGLVIDDQPIAWTAAIGLTLSKREGFVYAVLIAIAYLVSHPRVRRLPLRRRALPLVVFLPAVLHALWAKHSGATDPYDAPTSGAAALWGRVPVLLGRLPAVADARTILWSGCAGALLVAILFLRRVRGWDGLAALALALVFTFFALTAMVTSPHDLVWHIATALGRLLGHPAVFAALAPLLLLETARAAGEVKEA